MTTREAYHYNPRHNQLEPINIQPTHLVNCINCQQLYPIDEIEKHLQSHLQNIPVSPVASLHKSSAKLSLDEYFSAKHSKDKSIIAPSDVKTMLPEEMPQKQQTRKHIVQPQHKQHYSILSETTGQKMSYFTADSNLGLDNNLRMDLHDDLQRQDIEIDDYYQPFTVDRSDIQVPVRNVKVYLSSKLQASNTDAHVEVKKTRQTKLSLSSRFIEDEASVPQKPNNVYTLDEYSYHGLGKTNNAKIRVTVDSLKQISLPVQNFARIPTTSRQTNMPSRVRPELNKISASAPPSPTNERPRYDRIKEHKQNMGPEIQNTTTTTSSSFFSFMQCIGKSKCDNQYREQQYEITSHREPTTHHTQESLDRSQNNFSCKACGGFYCPVCKSTVPPQYRPPPSGLNGLKFSASEHNHSTNMNTTEFYP